MDLKITHKEEVLQPEGKLNVLKPDTFEIYPVFLYIGDCPLDGTKFINLLIDRGVTASIEAGSGTYVLTYSTIDSMWHTAGTAFSASSIGLDYPNPSNDDTVTVTKFITDAETVSGQEEIFQMATFAAVKQRGNDPLALDEGNRWAETVLGELPVDVVMQDVQESVRSVDNWCRVIFSTIKGADGYEYLMYTVSGLSKENP